MLSFQQHSKPVGLNTVSTSLQHHIGRAGGVGLDKQYSRTPHTNAYASRPRNPNVVPRNNESSPP
jgi:hypothetical protein